MTFRPFAAALLALALPLRAQTTLPAAPAEEPAEEPGPTAVEGANGPAPVAIDAASPAAGLAAGPAAGPAAVPPAELPVLVLAPPPVPAIDAALPDDLAHPYRPLADVPLFGWRLRTPVQLRSRVEAVSPFAVDADGSTLSTTPGIQLQARVGVSADSHHAVEPMKVVAEAEADARLSPLPPTLEGIGLPYSEASAFELRKLFVRASFVRYLHVALGAQTSHWGMGLLANDGAHGWEPGNARFADPKGGDRVLRASVASGPHQDFFDLYASVAGDMILGDDIANVPGDRAMQALAAVMVGYGKPQTAGVYVVRRHQDATAGGALDVWVADATARGSYRLFGKGTLILETEGVAIFGDTNVAPTASFVTQDVLQLGAAARATLWWAELGGVVDVLYASGDQNADDKTQNAFKADPNYEVGFLLYRNLVAGLSGRAPATAGDPNLVGKPAPGLDRLPSRGSATNTIAVFPRALWRPLDGLEVFGGPLVAFAPAKPSDPLRTRLAGGTLRNAFDGAPGNYLGTEVDVGVRYRLMFSRAELVLGAEAGALVPGDAYSTASSGIGTLPPIGGARFTLGARL